MCGATTLNTMSFSIMTLSIKDTQQKGHSAETTLCIECHYAECQYAKCYVLSIITLSFLMLSVVVLKDIILSVVKLNVDL
jgi:hypothetical protein